MFKSLRARLSRRSPPSDFDKDARDDARRTVDEQLDIRTVTKYGPNLRDPPERDDPKDHR